MGITHYHNALIQPSIKSYYGSANDAVRPRVAKESHEKGGSSSSRDPERDDAMTSWDPEADPITQILSFDALAEKEASPIKVTLPPGKVEYIKDMKVKNAETLQHGKWRSRYHPITGLTNKFEKKMEQFQEVRSQLEVDVNYDAVDEEILIEVFQSMCRAKMAVDNFFPIAHDKPCKTLDGREVSRADLEKVYADHGKKFPLGRWCGGAAESDDKPVPVPEELNEDTIAVQATAEEGNFFQRWGNAFYNLMF